MTKRIASTIGYLERHHPELGRHLRRSVRTGTFCCYSPEAVVDWEIAEQPQERRVATPPAK